MDDTKTLLYILMAIGWLIYNFIKKNNSKKNAPAPKQDDSESNAPGDVITMLEELLGEKSKKAAPKPLPVENSVKVLSKPPKPKSKYFSLEDEAMAKIEGAPEKRVKPVFKEIKLIEESGIELDLDPRKMILYSEIMKRPNY